MPMNGRSVGYYSSPLEAPGAPTTSLLAPCARGRVYIHLFISARKPGALQKSFVN